MKKPKIYYSASGYISHARVAVAYKYLIQNKYDLTTNLDKADVVILHEEPHTYKQIYESHPRLRDKYVVGCCVWEATELPESYRQGMTHVQEAWTCSQYSQDVFSKHHSNVVLIPCTIDRNQDCSDADRAAIKQAIRYDPQYTYFLLVTRVSDKRKNAHFLVDAFQRLQKRMPRARLIIKTRQSSTESWARDERIVCLSSLLTDSQINALYELADVYVSPHHAEGWGLTISDAMLFRKPVIATGYSGNMEFMNESNSFPLQYSEEPIRPADCFWGFTTAMKWAYPVREDLESKLIMLSESHRENSVKEKVERAHQDIQAFRPDIIERLIFERLDSITGMDSTNWRRADSRDAEHGLMGRLKGFLNLASRRNQP